MILSIGFWVQVYDDELKKKQEQLSQEAVRIDSVITDSMDYTTQYASFIGEKIVQHGNPHDLTYIASLISDRLGAQAQEHNFYYTTTFDWVNPGKMLLVSNKIGRLPKPFDMRDRDYLQRTPLYPWTLQLSPPRIGGLSGKWILPAGIGITDEQNQFIGSITLGFSLEGLAQRIGQIIGGDTHYLLLTNDSQLILDSSADNATGPNPQFALDIPAGKNALEKSRGFLPEPISYNGADFSYYRKLDKYPYIILTGYSAGMASALFTEVVLSRSIGLLSIIIAGLGMLYVMRRRLIEPVAELARAADDIRKGKQIDIEETHIHEIDILGKSLKKISAYVQNEHRINEELGAKKELLESQAERLQEATKEALASRDEAISANRAKSEFLTNMSHELRTPMNAIVGLTEILAAQKITPARQHEFFNTLRVSAQQLLGLINSLLDLSKIESQHLELEHIPFDFKNILEEVIAINDVKAREKGILLTMHYAGAEGQVVGDPLRIKQVLLNLISNAVKFTEHGYVAVQATCQLSSDEQGALFKLDIKDSGIGIKDEYVKNIFNKFTQADASITRKYGGSGLGLAISKELVEMMGGSISIASAHGRGSCFTVMLPLPLYKPSQIIYPVFGAPVADYVIEGKHTPRTHILLVEDYKANILVATALLEHFGYTHSVAQNGQEALQKVKNETFSLVLMDVQMPTLDGFETTRLIRAWEKQEGRCRLPIIGMTAHALAGDCERCLDAGMDDYISKPFNPPDLMHIIEKHLLASNASNASAKREK